MSRLRWRAELLGVAGLLVAGLFVLPCGPASASSAAVSSTAQVATNRVRDAMRGVGLDATPAEPDCVASGVKQARASLPAVPVEVLLGCFPQEILVEQFVSRGAITSELRPCLTRSLRSTPSQTFADLYSVFVAVADRRYAADPAFRGRFEPLVRSCRVSTASAGPALLPVVPGLVLADLTERWNAAALRRRGSGFRLIAEWESIPNGPLSAGSVSSTATLVALQSAGQATGASPPGAPSPDIALDGAALTVRPVPDLRAATAAVAMFVEAVDSSGRADAVASSMNLAELLRPGSAPKRVRVGSVVYSALVATPKGGSLGFQITAIIAG